jgi:CheY-like chemotaxis protein
VEALRKIAVGKTVAIYQQHTDQEGSRSSNGLAWQCVEKYCKSWFGFNTYCGNDERALFSADLIIQQNSFGSSRTPDTLPRREAIRTLVICDSTSDRKSREQNRRIQCIGSPVGPYKLARAVLELFREQVEKSSSDTDISVVYAFSEGSTRNSMSSISFPPSREEANVECIYLGASVPEPTKISQSLETSESIPQSTQLQQPTPPNGTTTGVGLTQILQNVPASSYSPQALGTASMPGSNLHDAQAPLRLLLVDDNPLNLQLLHRYLLKRKLDALVIARNGVEAFTNVREAKVPFDVIFMDISMPEMDGFEATRLIRTYERTTQHREFTAETIEFNSTDNRDEGAAQENGTIFGDGYNAEAHQDGKAYEDREKVVRAQGGSHHAYIVALTGLASRRDRDRAEECGFDEYLTKPISFSKIGELLERLSAGKMCL